MYRVAGTHRTVGNDHCSLCQLAQDFAVAEFSACKPKEF